MDEKKKNNCNIRQNFDLFYKDAIQRNNYNIKSYFKNYISFFFGV